jgi:hypothetical protein
MKQPTTLPKIEYREALVTFVDILGFRELVRATPDANDLWKKIAEFRRSLPAEDEYAEELHVITFSDSIVRVRWAHTESAVFYEFMDLLHAQASMANAGVLVRGGVALGKVSSGSHGVFGPAFIDAYDLESKFASFPRIVVSPQILARIADGSLPPARHNQPAHEAQEIRNLLRQGEDGVWFIDYLRAMESEAGGPEEYIDFLSSHRDAILRHLAQRKVVQLDLDAVGLKLSWLARYHNEHVRSLRENTLAQHGSSAEDLCIPTDQLPYTSRFDSVKLGTND